jgi:hypothetical protein
MDFRTTFSKSFINTFNKTYLIASCFSFFLTILHAILKLTIFKKQTEVGKHLVLIIPGGIFGILILVSAILVPYIIPAYIEILESVKKQEYNGYACISEQCEVQTGFPKVVEQTSP